MPPKDLIRNAKFNHIVTETKIHHFQVLRENSQILRTISPSSPLPQLEKHCFIVVPPKCAEGCEALFLLPLCDISWGDMNKHLFIPDRALIADQRNDCTQDYHSKQVSLLVLHTGTWARGSYKEASQKQLHHWNVTPAWVKTCGSYIPIASCCPSKRLSQWGRSCKQLGCCCLYNLGEECESCTFQELLVSCLFL